MINGYYWVKLSPEIEWEIAERTPNGWYFIGVEDIFEDVAQVGDKVEIRDKVEITTDL